MLSWETLFDWLVTLKCKKLEISRHIPQVLRSVNCILLKWLAFRSFSHLQYLKKLVKYGKHLINATTGQHARCALWHFLIASSLNESCKMPWLRFFGKCPPAVLRLQPACACVVQGQIRTGLCTAEWHLCNARSSMVPCVSLWKIFKLERRSLGRDLSASNLKNTCTKRKSMPICELITVSSSHRLSNARFLLGLE